MKMLIFSNVFLLEKICIVVENIKKFDEKKFILFKKLIDS